MLNEEVAKVIGENVRRYRKEKGYTQERLAEEANIDRTAISKLEKGKFLPTISFILAISLARHPSEILSEEGYDAQHPDRCLDA